MQKTLNTLKSGVQQQKQNSNSFSSNFKQEVLQELGKQRDSTKQELALVHKGLEELFQAKKAEKKEREELKKQVENKVSLEEVQSALNVS